MLCILLSPHLAFLYTSLCMFCSVKRKTVAFPEFVFFLYKHVLAKCFDSRSQEIKRENNSASANEP